MIFLRNVYKCTNKAYFLNNSYAAIQTKLQNIINYFS